MSAASGSAECARATNLSECLTHFAAKTFSRGSDGARRCARAFQPPKAKKVEKVVENVALGPQVKEGELVFGVAHIFASFNDTFVHVTDLSGKETLVRITGRPASAPRLVRLPSPLTRSRAHPRAGRLRPQAA